MPGLRGRRVLLGVCGGIAAYKAAFLARELRAEGADVTAVLTASATRFVGVETFAGLTGNPAYASLWEARHRRSRRPRADADVLVIAPATANMLAKLAHGLADDLLSATALEFRGPIVVAPAMHAGMWTSPATQANVAALAARGVRFVGPVEGALAHGDEGIGRLASPRTSSRPFAQPPRNSPTSSDRLPVAGSLVTAGPTYEPIDPVRFVGNRSSGKMGVAIASEALARGATVTLVLGPGTVAPPVGVDVIRVDTAEAMREAVLARADADAVVMAAAVADFRPKVAADRKLKKDARRPRARLRADAGHPAPSSGSGRRSGPGAGGVRGRDRRRRGGRARQARPQGSRSAGCERSWARPATGFGADTNDAAILARRGRGRRAAHAGRRPSSPAALWDRIAAGCCRQRPHDRSLAVSARAGRLGRS